MCFGNLLRLEKVNPLASKGNGREECTRRCNVKNIEKIVCVLNISFCFFLLYSCIAKCIFTPVCYYYSIFTPDIYEILYPLCC